MIILNKYENTHLQRLRHTNMKYLTILDYTNCTTIVEPDPCKNDSTEYEEYIFKKYGNIDMYYMVGENLNIKI